MRVRADRQARPLRVQRYGIVSQVEEAFDATGDLGTRTASGPGVSAERKGISVAVA